MEEKYCFCGGEAEGFMIECDGCNVWFHGKCLRINKKSCKDLKQWFCVACTNLAKNGIGDVKQIQQDFQNFKLEIKQFFNEKVENEEKFQKDLNEARTEIISLGNYIKELEQNLKIKGKELDSIQEENARDQDDILRATEALQKMTEEKRILEEKLRDLSKTPTELIVLKELNEELSQSQATNENTVVELVNNNCLNCREGKNLLEEEFKVLKKELEEAYTEIRSLKSRNNELSERILSLNKRRKLSLSQR
ncbi:CXXC-type zinc finger protein 1 [Frankliniella fusca]|uniref:CXXC-type zinc finger protein 1 n=1 Tax=Frankliniella fusca TaxID=407009 RepID=A0AAE1GV77_9NEOP|nr:CXXC-type zinc finger protein 1 [Frankliniella fusca]